MNVFFLARVSAGFLCFQHWASVGVSGGLSELKDANALTKDSSYCTHGFLKTLQGQMNFNTFLNFYAAHSFFRGLLLWCERENACMSLPPRSVLCAMYKWVGEY